MFSPRWTYSSDNLKELENIWHEIIQLDKGWDVHKPLNTRWNWKKFDYEFYFVVKYNYNSLRIQMESENKPKMGEK